MTNIALTRATYDVDGGPAEGEGTKIDALRRSRALR
jgi:hypothetical protein